MRVRCLDDPNERVGTQPSLLASASLFVRDCNAREELHLPVGYHTWLALSPKALPRLPYGPAASLPLPPLPRPQKVHSWQPLTNSPIEGARTPGLLFGSPTTGAASRASPAGCPMRPRAGPPTLLQGFRSCGPLTQATGLAARLNPSSYATADHDGRRRVG